MTRQEFIAAFRHEVDGMMLDAAMSCRTGAELSIFLRMMRAKIESKLGAMYDALAKEQSLEPLIPGAANGRQPNKI